MKIGTKSVLIGAHCFFLHPFFVARAWWKLYGFPWDPRLWVAFFVHDLGYIGKPNMDGPEGENHPYLGARIMRTLFDWPRMIEHGSSEENICGELITVRYWITNNRWFDFCLFHSRYLAKRFSSNPSRLCIADKLAIVITPAWLYLPMVRLTGEVHEYMDVARKRAQSSEQRAISDDENARFLSGAQRDWYAALQSYIGRWVEEHKDGRTDSWVSERREALNTEGVTR